MYFLDIFLDIWLIYGLYMAYIWVYMGIYGYIYLEIIKFNVFSKNEIGHEIAKNGSFGGIMHTCLTAIAWRLILYGQNKSEYAKNSHI